MFFNFFLSKNQKLVQQWKVEHQEIVAIATDIITNFDNKDSKYIRKKLTELHAIAVMHLMDEDLEMYDLIEENSDLDKTTETLIKEFRESFRGTKTTVMNFLTHHTLPDVELDQKFIENFKELVGALAARIAFEEENLYSRLEDNTL